MQTSIKSTSKRSTLVRCIKNQTAKLASKKPAKQADLFAPLPDLNEAAPAVTAPAASGQVVGLPICVFPQPKFVDVQPFITVTGNEFDGCRLLRDDFFGFNHSGLDAPCYLPLGGTDSLGIRDRVVAFSFVVRA